MNTQEDWTGQTVLFRKSVNAQELTPHVGGAQETVSTGVRSGGWSWVKGEIETYKEIETLCTWTAINGVSKTFGGTR